MKILPRITAPWSRKIARRHRPPVARGKRGYKKYLPCLRWDFSFCCAFCLIHEADLSSNEIRNSGLMEIEHFLPQSRYPKYRNRYTNCFYSCRYCNRARRAVENLDLEGNQLLNPCKDVWKDFFKVVNDRLVPQTGNGDAEYTCDTY